MQQQNGWQQQSQITLTPQQQQQLAQLHQQQQHQQMQQQQQALPPQSRPPAQIPGIANIPPEQIKAFLRRAGLPDDVDTLTQQQVAERMMMASRIIQQEKSGVIAAT